MHDLAKKKDEITKYRGKKQLQNAALAAKCIFLNQMQRKVSSKIKKERMKKTIENKTWNN